MDTPASPPEGGIKIGFGTPAAAVGATPQGIKMAYRTLFFLTGLWAILEPNFPEIPIKITHNLDKFLLLGNVVIYYICQQFGWVVPKNENVK